MKNKFILIFIIIFSFFCFLVLFKALNNSNIYSPKIIINKNLINFNLPNLFTNENISSEEIFKGSKFYILNIWASWCMPCRDEHPILMQLNKNPKIKIIGLNYKDSFVNAKKFINKFGNPYSDIIIDKKGIISIELGAYGVPETFIIDENKKIIKKFTGPLNNKTLKEINLLTK
jgi:cytochrome c biogenesis protein CcmG, thiol:disulfide interchange protein DsbE